MKHFYIFLLAISNLFLPINTCKAQAGALDPTFGTGGIVVTSIGPAADKINAVAVQADGKIIAVGSNTVTGIDNDITVVRYNPDGTLDNTFGSGGIVTTAIGTDDDQGLSVAIQPDGKIVVGGLSDEDTSYSVINDFALVRYNSNGSLDGTFGTGGMVTTHIGPAGFISVIYSIALQSDGKIVAAGFSNYLTGDFAIARYNDDGSLDNLFGTGGIVTTDFGGLVDYAFSVAIQATDGKIIVGGSMIPTGGGPSDFAMARYNTDGNLDITFGSGGKVNVDMAGGTGDVCNSIAIQSDGKILQAGFSYISAADFCLLRYKSDGTLDSTFATNGKTATDFAGGADYARQVVLQSDGKIVVAGTATASLHDFGIARYATNGTLDNSFGTGGKVTTDIAGGSDDFAYSIAIQPDGKIVAGGNEYGDFALARYEVSGSLNVSDQDILSAISMYPNPSNGEVTISGSGISNGECTLILKNVLGKNIFFDKANIANNTIRKTFSVSELPYGIYFMSIETTQKRIVKKLVIQK